MNSWRWSAAVRRLSLLLLALCPLGSAFAQCADQWLFGPDQGDPGIPGDVYATVEWTMNTPEGPRQVLVAGGLFKSAGQSLANSIAYWDGTWHSLSSGLDPNQPPFNQTIRALCVYQGDLIAAGSFHHIDNVAAGNIARWDGSAWSPLDIGTDGTVQSLCVIGNTLYAAGQFNLAGGNPAKNIAAWNGAAWSALGDGLTNTSSGGIQTLVEYQGLLRAGGNFTISGVSGRGLATWNGSTWQGHSGFSAISSLCTYNGVLYGSDGSTAVRKWNGTLWANAGATGQTVGNAKKLVQHDGRLVAVGTFTSGGGVSANSVIAFDGVKWSAVGSGIRDPRDGSDFTFRSATTFGSKLIVAGLFTTDAPRSRSIVQWDGTEWSAVGAGICVPPPPFSSLAGQAPLVTAFEEWNGDLVMAGILSASGPVSNIAIRRAGEWKPLGDQLEHSSWEPIITSLTTFDGKLVVGGTFDRAGETNLNYVAAWNGTQWSPLGVGVGGPVHALAAFEDDLIVAGQFSTAGGAQTLHIARWDGAMWHPVGLGANNIVYALTLYRGELIAGGKFTSMGDVEAAHVARWDGERWAPLGLGIDDPDGAVFALTVHRGDLIVGGMLHSAGGVAARSAARWNGQTWSPLGNELNGGVFALADHRGSLYAVGKSIFNPFPNPFALAKWNGSSWQREGTGFDRPGQTLLSSENELLIGGSFTRANDQVSIAWARYGGCAYCPADLNGDNNVTDTDFAIFTTAYDILDCSSPDMPAGCNADFSHDGFVDDADFLAFITGYDAMTCP